LQDHKDTNEEDSAPTVENVEVAVQKIRITKPQEQTIHQQNYLDMVETN